MNSIKVFVGMFVPIDRPHQGVPRSVGPFSLLIIVRHVALHLSSVMRSGRSLSFCDTAFRWRH